VNRDQFRLVLERLARVLPDEQQVVIIGSQAAHAWSGELPDDVLLSREVDVAPIDDADEQKAYRINWVIGEESPFDDEHDVYAEGVSLDMFAGPTGWLSRCKRIVVARTNGTDLEVLCPDLHDLSVAKLIAGREQDQVFVTALVRDGFVEADRLEYLLTGTDASPHEITRARSMIASARRA
jgi:hypothetical protein